MRIATVDQLRDIMIITSEEAKRLGILPSCNILAAEISVKIIEALIREELRHVKENDDDRVHVVQEHAREIGHLKQLLGFAKTAAKDALQAKVEEEKVAEEDQPTTSASSRSLKECEQEKQKQTVATARSKLRANASPYHPTEARQLHNERPEADHAITSTEVMAVSDIQKILRRLHFPDKQGRLQMQAAKLCLFLYKIDKRHQAVIAKGGKLKDLCHRHPDKIGFTSDGVHKDGYVYLVGSGSHHNTSASGGQGKGKGKGKAILPSPSFSGVPTAPNAPNFGSTPPGYSPTSPAYSPTPPAEELIPMTPMDMGTPMQMSPFGGAGAMAPFGESQFSPGGAQFSPAPMSPGFSPAHGGSSPAYSPTSPAYSPTSPAYSPEAKEQAKNEQKEKRVAKEQEERQLQQLTRRLAGEKARRLKEREREKRKQTVATARDGMRANGLDTEFTRQVTSNGMVAGATTLQGRSSQCFGQEVLDWLGPSPDAQPQTVTIRLVANANEDSEAMKDRVDSNVACVALSDASRFKQELRPEDEEDTHLFHLLNACEFDGNFTAALELFKQDADIAELGPPALSYWATRAHTVNGLKRSGKGGGKQGEGNFDLDEDLACYITAYTQEWFAYQLHIWTPPAGSCGYQNCAAAAVIQAFWRKLHLARDTAKQPSGAAAAAAVIEQQQEETTSAKEQRETATIYKYTDKPRNHAPTRFFGCRVCQQADFCSAFCLEKAWTIHKWPTSTKPDCNRSLYSTVNKRLRCKTFAGHSAMLIFTKMLMRALGTLPLHYGTVYRSLSRLSKAGWLEFCAYGTGQSFAFNSFSSTSTDQQASEHFLGDDKPDNLRVLLTIECVVGFSVMRFSEYAHESEILIPPGAVFEVIGSEVTGSRLNLHVLQKRPSVAVMQSLGIVELPARVAAAKVSLDGCKYYVTRQEENGLMSGESAISECTNEACSVHVIVGREIPQEAEHALVDGVETEKRQEKKASQASKGKKRKGKKKQVKKRGNSTSREKQVKKSVAVGSEWFSVEDLASMDTRELKQLLKDRGIATDGCEEKKELIAKIRAPVKSIAEYEVPHGSRYQIAIANAFSTRCQVRVFVDGHFVGAWVLRPKEVFTTERPVGTARCFTFFRESLAVHAQDKATEFAPAGTGIKEGRKENGTIMCEFTPELRA
jgi:hypothetical protein